MVGGSDGASEHPVEKLAHVARSTKHKENGDETRIEAWRQGMGELAKWG